MPRVCFLLVSSVLALSSCLRDMRVRYACEGQFLTITCPYAFHVRVSQANYGRLLMGTCNDDGVTSGWDTNCYSNSTTRKVTERCSTRRTCILMASSSEYHDNCPLTPKYLEVNYHCALNPGVHSTTAGNLAGKTIFTAGRRFSAAGQDTFPQIAELLSTLAPVEPFYSNDSGSKPTKQTKTTSSATDAIIAVSVMLSLCIIAVVVGTLTCAYVKKVRQPKVPPPLEGSDMSCVFSGFDSRYSCSSITQFDDRFDPDYYAPNPITVDGRRRTKRWLPQPTRRRMFCDINQPVRRREQPSFKQKDPVDLPANKLTRVDKDTFDFPRKRPQDVLSRPVQTLKSYKYRRNVPVLFKNRYRPSPKNSYEPNSRIDSEPQER